MPNLDKPIYKNGGDKRMSKKMKFIVGVICMAVVGCIGGVGYVLYNVQQQMNESLEVIAQLEQEVISANENADQAVEKAKAAKKRLKKADSQIEHLKKEKEEIIEAHNIEAESEATETPMPTPEPTTVATEVPKSSDVPDITGSWVDTMSSRTKMNISYRENRPGFDIVIDASDGAVTGTEFLVGTDGYDASIGGFPYHGAAYRYEYNNVTYRDNTLISSDMSGVLKYSNDHLYWVDNTNLIAYQNLEFQRQ